MMRSMAIHGGRAAEAVQRTHDDDRLVTQFLVPFSRAFSTFNIVLFLEIPGI
jgi:hypothetical protein